jgi:hypothetical protein
MGNQPSAPPSAPPSPSPPLPPPCDPNCQKQKDLALLKVALDTATENQDQDPAGYEKARIAYYTLLNGQGWLNTEKQRIATEDVQRGSGSTVNIPVHRNLITTLSTPVNAVIGEYGTTVSMGGSTYTGITFQVILRDYPTYTLVPCVANDSFIQWSGSFKAFEDVL